MKKRNGFVSNSSSSSFLLAVRNGYDISELTGGAGVFVRVAQGLVAWLEKDMKDSELLPFQAARQKHMADTWGNNWKEDLHEDAQDTFARFRDRCRRLAAGPWTLNEWRFFEGYASYNDGENMYEQLIGSGLSIQRGNVRIDSES